MRRADLTRPAETALTAMPDGVHEEALALVGDIADARAGDAGWMTVVDAVLRGPVWVVYVAIGGLLVVLDTGRAA
ncbi:hypothetical protein ACFWVU_25475 [Streptomyces sp. NPDC058686]|uniref:hypothetical protein n=1 Tax=Streptomyces sp. NPDC058686 TaxID=3346599 RepID=UPI00364B7FAB